MSGKLTNLKVLAGQKEADLEHVLLKGVVLICSSWDYCCINRLIKHNFFYSAKETDGTEGRFE